MSARQGQIPGLYSSDKNLDWSNDSMSQDQSTSDNSNVGNISQSQNNTMLLLRSGPNLISELRMEKDSLGLNFVHSHRLLESG